MAEVQGTVAPGFERVEEVFRDNLVDRGEVGAALAVLRDGEVLVDLWGGHADRELGRPWVEDTLGVVFSCTKGLMAACYLLLEDRGLDLDQPLRTWWPELKSTGTLRQLLNHRVGLSVLDQQLSVDDFLAQNEAWLRAAEAQEPVWSPGTDQGYGATALGVIAGELFRRISGQSVGTFLRDELAGPLEAEAWIGLPPEQQDRVSTLYRPSRAGFRSLLPDVHRSAEGRAYGELFFKKKSLTHRALSNPKDLGLAGLHNYNRPEVRALELPWANGVASARGLATVMGMLAAGGSWQGRRYVSEARIEPLKQRQSFARDRVMKRDQGFSQGFVKEAPPVFSPNPEGFGHPGAGGSVAWADPVEGIGIGYVMNQMSPRIRSRRCQRLCEAVYACF